MNGTGLHVRSRVCLQLTSRRSQLLPGGPGGKIDSNSSFLRQNSQEGREQAPRATPRATKWVRPVVDLQDVPSLTATCTLAGSGPFHTSRTPGAPKPAGEPKLVGAIVSSQQTESSVAAFLQHRLLSRNERLRGPLPMLSLPLLPFQPTVRWMCCIESRDTGRFTSMLSV